MAEGFIYARKDRRRTGRRWYAVLRVNGGRQFHSAEPNTREAAKRLLADLQRDRAAGTIDQRDLTLSQYLQSWLTTVRPSVAPATWKQHESIVRLHLLPALGRHRLSDLSVAAVRSYLSGSRLDPQSTRHHRATLRRALADAHRDGLVTRNVAALAEPPKLTRKERPTLDAAHTRRLIDGTRDDRLGPLWTLAVTTGMRAAEMIGLQWEDIDGATLHVRHTLHWLDGKPVLMEPKTRKSRRSIHLTDVAIDALERQRKRQLEDRMKAGRPGKDGLVFTNRFGYAYRGNNLVPFLHDATDRLDLPRVTVHDLRHSCATLLHSMGVPIEVIADILGHSSTRVTADLYRHRVPELAKDAAAAMQRAVG